MIQCKYIQKNKIGKVAIAPYTNIYPGNQDLKRLLNAKDLKQDVKEALLKRNIKRYEA